MGLSWSTLCFVFFDIFYCNDSQAVTWFLKFVERLMMDMSIFINVDSDYLRMPITWTHPWVWHAVDLKFYVEQSTYCGSLCLAEDRDDPYIAWLHCWHTFNICSLFIITKNNTCVNNVPYPVFDSNTTSYTHITMWQVLNTNVDAKKHGLKQSQLTISVLPVMGILSRK